MQPSPSRAISWVTDRRLYFLVLACYLVTRLLVLFSAPHAIFDDEELYNGTAARELLRGLRLPLGEYMYFPHEGGALVMTLLTVPFFLLGGTSYVLMKLPSLLVSALTFLIWFHFTLRFLGRREAIYLALLFIFAPPLLLKSDLMLWGHHNNVGLFIALGWFLLLKVFNPAGFGRGRFWLLLLAFTCGFGLFFAYLFFPFFLAILLSLFLLASPRPRLRDLLPALAAFSMGLSPWLILNFGSDFAGLEVMGGAADASISLAGMAHRAGILLTHHLPAAASFEQPAISTVHGILLMICAAALLPLAMVHQGNRRRVPLSLLFGIAIFVLVYLVSPFEVGDTDSELRFIYIDYRYLLPLYPLLFLAAASLFSTVQERLDWFGLDRIFAGLAALLIVAAGGVSIAESCRWGEMGRSFSFRGFSYEVMGWRMSEKYPGEPERMVEILEIIDPSFAEDAWRGVAWEIAENHRAAELTLGQISRLPPPRRPLAYEGLGWAVADGSHGDAEELDRIAAMLPRSQICGYYLGAGWLLGSRFFRDLPSVMPYMAQIPERCRGSAFAGVGRAYEGTRQGRVAPDSAFIASLPAAYRKSFEAGRIEVRGALALGKFYAGPNTIRWNHTSIYDYMGRR